MQDGSAIGESLIDIEDSRQLLVLDIDEVDRFLGRVLVVGSDGRDALARIADAAIGEDGHVADRPAVDVAAEVGAG